MVYIGLSFALTMWATFTAESPSKIVQSVSVSPDCKVLASGGWDGRVRLWDITNATQLHCLQGHTDLISCVRFANHVVISGSWDHTVRVWDAATGKHLRTFVGEDRVCSVAVTKNGRCLVAAFECGKVVSWNLETGEKESTRIIDVKKCNIVLSKDGAYAAAPSQLPGPTAPDRKRGQPVLRLLRPRAPTTRRQDSPANRAARLWRARLPVRH